MIGTVFVRFSCHSLDPLYQKFVDLDVPLFVHASSTNGVDNLQDLRLSAHHFSLSLGYAQEEAIAVAQILLGVVLDRHPDIDICVSTAAAPSRSSQRSLSNWLRSTRQRRRCERSWLRPELQKLWFDSHVKGEGSGTPPLRIDCHGYEFGWL